MHLDKERNVKLVITNVQSEYEGETITNQTVIEAVDGFSEGVRVLVYELEDSLNVLMLSDNYVKLVKSGDTEAEMVFSEGKKSQAIFSAEGQKLVLDVFTGLCQTKKADYILKLEYSLYMEAQLLSEYKLNIKEVL